MNDVEDEWLAFLNNGSIPSNKKISSLNADRNNSDLKNCIERDDKLDSKISQHEETRTSCSSSTCSSSSLDDDINTSPKCSDIYISTKTKISYLDSPLDLNHIFWQIPIIQYHEQREGIIKKQMKFQTTDREVLNDILEKMNKYYYSHSDIINSIDNPTGKIVFKDTRKINIGICKKDILNTRCKTKSAFYNCFVIVFRLLVGDAFREIHIKIFNTGKLEIPGVKDDWLLDFVLDRVVNLLSNVEQYRMIRCIKDRTETVLINSNFNCGYYINRDRLYEILRNRYKINCCYDPCSYPGIQCGFYYNVVDPDFKQTGSQPLTCKTDFIKISFMVFRTGSVLMVGKCTEEILFNIYGFIRNILEIEYQEIQIDDYGESLLKQKDRERPKKHKKKYIYI
jgi:hypothetical protein